MFTSTEKYLGLTLKDRYRLERFLGEGLRGLAFLAYDSLLEGWVVVKVIKDEIEGFPVPIGEEWIDEPKKAMQVRSHPHIAAILDLGDEVVVHRGEKTRIPYIVWEYIQGTSLQDMLNSGEKVSFRELVDIARQFCHTLLFLKEKKLNHGDLHPRNVMTLHLPSGETTIKLIDFGMARNVLTTQGRHDDTTGVLNILSQMVDRLLAAGPSRESISGAAILRDLVRRASNLLPAGKMSLEEFTDGIEALKQYCVNSGDPGGDMEGLRRPRLAAPKAGPLPDFFGRREELETVFEVARKAFTHRFTHRIFILGDTGSGKTAAIKRAISDLSESSGAVVLNYFVHPTDYQRPYSSLAGFWLGLTSDAGGRSRLETILSKFPHVQAHFRERLPGLLSLFSAERLKGEGGLLLGEFADELRSLIRDAAKLIPLGIVFDDVHHADIETIRWLWSFETGEPGLSLALICAYSPCELNFIPAAEDHPLKNIPIDDPYSTVVELRPLQFRDVEALISSEFKFADSNECTKFTEFVMMESGGEPFCVSEIIKECISEGFIACDPVGRWLIQRGTEGFVLPSSVEAHAARRLMRLNQQEMTLIKWAAYFGPVFLIEGLHAVSRVDEKEFTAAMDSLANHHHLIRRRDDTQWAFAQPTIRKSLLKGTPFSERQAGLETVTSWQIERARRTRDPAFFGEIAANLHGLGRYRQACGFAMAAARGHLALRHYDLAMAAADQALMSPGEASPESPHKALQVVALKVKLEAGIHLSRFDEALAASDKLASLADEAEDVDLKLNAAMRKVLALRLKCDYPAAEEQVHATIKLAKRYGKPKIEGEALRELGTVRYLKGEFEKAIDAFLMSAKVLDEMGEVHSAAKTYNNLGLVYKQMGDYAPMEESLRAAISKYREAGDKAGERLPLANLGLFHQQVGRFDEAKRCFDDILRQLEPGENPSFEAKARLSLAQVQSSIGLTEEAVSMAEHALHIFTEINDMQGQAETMSLLGDIAIDNGQYNLAKEYHKRSLKLKEEIGSEMGICHSKLRLARVAMHEAKFDIVLSLAREVTERARKKGWTKLTIEGITEMIRALSERDGPSAALKVLKENRAYEGMVGDPAMVLLDYNLTAAQAYFDNGMAAEAMRHINAFEEYYTRVMESINDEQVRKGFAAKMEGRASLATELRGLLKDAKKSRM